MQRTGEFFHIDFGHFLGHWKSALGVRRDAAFVLTPSMAAVLGGEGSSSWRELETLSANAFNALRRRARLLVTLVSLMVGCGIPEVSGV